MMDWVEPFYRLQGEWADLYSGNVSQESRDRAALLRQQVPDGGFLLELGAGGGEAAAAAAIDGWQVTAVELVGRAAANARRLAADLERAQASGSLSVLEADMYDVELEPGAFDAVSYWDGFGVGSDSDQSRLLRRVRGWLSPAGVALIDVYNPLHWAGAHGRRFVFDSGGDGASYESVYSYDARGGRMVNRWAPVDGSHPPIEQSLRCYAPADLELVLRDTGLRLVDVVPGGTLRRDPPQWVEKASLVEAMTWLAVLRPGR